MKYILLFSPWILITILVIEIDINHPFIHNTKKRSLFQLENVQQQQHQQHDASLPVIYAITLTYSRAVQKAELTRLANTFRQVPQFHWIVVEDSNSQTELVSQFLARSGLRYTHLNVSTLQMFRGGGGGMPSGTEQRNAAHGWIRGHLTSEGVVFFADDDNTYSLELFEELHYQTQKVNSYLCLRLRSTRRVAVWPVGLVAGQRYERPLVVNGTVVGWYTGWRGGRPFAIDTAGFAVNLQVILSNPRPLFRRRGAIPGMQVSHFLKQITKVEEPKARNCTQVLVWHTRTEKVNIDYEVKDSVFVEV